MNAIELVRGATTLRLVPNELRYRPEGARFPNSNAIEPNSLDKDDAKRRGTPVRVSVWDRARTTVAQAVAFRRTEKPLLAYELSVDGVLAVSAQFENVRLRVVEDPLEEHGESAGAAGHCGVEGLDRGVGQPRVVWRDMLDELVRYCVEVSDPALAP